MQPQLALRDCDDVVRRTDASNQLLVAIQSVRRADSNAPVRMPPTRVDVTTGLTLDVGGVRPCGDCRAGAKRRSALIGPAPNARRFSRPQKQNFRVTPDVSSGLNRILDNSSAPNASANQSDTPFDLSIPPFVM
jgi:hypothetical protein